MRKTLIALELFISSVAVAQQYHDIAWYRAHPEAIRTTINRCLAQPQRRSMEDMDDCNAAFLAHAEQQAREQK
jgi:hypothetical protein